MAKLALEIPIPNLKEFSVLTDFDFALAHLVLSNEVYAEFYSVQALRGREVWLDNSINELNESVSRESVLRAAQRISATHVIPPEWITDPIRTFEEAIHWKKYGSKYKIVGVIHGSRPRDVLEGYRNHNILPALPYDEPRDWYKAQRDGPVHFLGFNSLKEIRDLKPASLDTGFPFRIKRKIAIDWRRPLDLPPLNYTKGIEKTDVVLDTIWRLKCMLDTH